MFSAFIDKCIEILLVYGKASMVILICNLEHPIMIFCQFVLHLYNCLSEHVHWDGVRTLRQMHWDIVSLWESKHGYFNLQLGASNNDLFACLCFIWTIV